MLVQNEIGHQAWGQYTALFSLSFLFTAFADVGINQFITKHTATKPEEYKSTFEHLYSFKIFSLFFYPIIITGIGYFLGYRGNTLIHLSIISFIAALIHLMQFYRAVFQGFQLFKIDAFASNADKLFLIIILAILLMMSITLQGYIFARLASVLLAAFVLRFFLIRKKLYHLPKLGAKKLKTLLRQSIPFALITIFYSIHERIDQVMLERMRDDGELVTGVYAAAYRWLDLSMMYLWIVLPMFFAKLSFHKTTLVDKNNLISTGVTITALPLIFVSGFGIFHGNQLFILFSNSSIAEISTMTNCVQILFCCLAIHGFCAILSTYLTSNGYTSFINLVMTFGIMINVGLNIIYIPEYGAIAAAWTTLISTGISCLAYILYIQFFTPIKLPYTPWVKLLFVSGVFYTGLHLLKTNNIHWLFSYTICAVITVTIAYFLDLINFKKLKHL